MMETVHCGDEDLSALIDGSAGERDGLRIRTHVQTCRSCAARVRELERLDTALRRMPVHRAPADLARTVLARLGIRQRPSLLFLLVEKAALGVGMIMVLSVVAGVFVATGVIDTGGVEEGGSRMREVAQQTGDLIGRAAAAVTAGVRTYMPFLAEGGAGGITLTVIVVLWGLLAADRVLGRKILQR